MSGFSIDELERDLGQTAKLTLLANAGGQTRYIPTPRNAAESALAKELGAEIVHWLAARHSGEHINFPSRHGTKRDNHANQLRASVLEAGLTHPTRSANDIASEFDVSDRRVRQVRRELREDAGPSPKSLPLFRDL